MYLQGPRCDVFSERLTFPHKPNGVKDTALILVREKMGKYVPLRVRSHIHYL